jgi:fatty acid synthase subunit alpha, fungi type
MAKARSDINSTAEIRKAVKAEDAKEQAFTADTSLASSPTLSINGTKIKPRTTLQVGFPSLPDYDKSLAPLEHLQGMVDPSSTIVIVGFSELGPGRSSRTRWQMENQGEFSQDGYIEMAWIMGLIKHFDGEEKGSHYVGWVDAKTGEQVHDSQIGEKYGR